MQIKWKPLNRAHKCSRVHPQHRAPRNHKSRRMNVSGVLGRWEIYHWLIGIRILQSQTPAIHYGESQSNDRFDGMTRDPAPAGCISASYPHNPSQNHSSGHAAATARRGENWPFTGVFLPRLFSQAHIGSICLAHHLTHCLVY